MKNLFFLLVAFLIITSCEDEQCVVCIAESKDGKVIDMRSACDSNSAYLNGFIDGFKQKHRENELDSIVVNCTSFK